MFLRMVTGLLSFPLVLLSAISQLHAEPAWVKDGATYPKGFVISKLSRKSDLRWIHGDGREVRDMIGRIDGFKVRLPAASENSSASVDVAKDSAIKIAKGIYRTFDWHIDCQGDANGTVRCLIKRYLFTADGQTPDGGAAIVIKDKETSICILSDTAAPIAGRIAIKDASLGISEETGCLSHEDTDRAMALLGGVDQPGITFTSSQATLVTTLSGLPTARSVASWLRENSFVPTREMQVEDFRNRFFACGWLGAELAQRTAEVDLDGFLDDVIRALKINAGFEVDEAEILKMRLAYLSGASKYSGEQSKPFGLEQSYRSCTGPGTFRYLEGWGVGYP